MTEPNDTAEGGGTPKDKKTERLMVAVRVRPMAPDEGLKNVHVLNNKTLIYQDDPDKNDVLRHRRGAGNRQFTYDVVFDQDATTEQVYETTTSPLVQDVLKGYNGTVFAYGATGAGKTHTMVGNPQNPGLMARAINELFQAVQDHENPDSLTVTISCMEIYNEQIRDLLNPNSGYLELREDSKKIQVANLTELHTTSTEQVQELLLKANKQRTVEPTAVNKTSSRSHALVSVTVTQTMPDKITRGRLFMIDLAGSERAAKTKNRGKRLQEGAHINRSLLALGNCINALSGGARYVNYRDSKLTRLLKDALSGNCRTVMIAHISPNSTETRNTLTYADRANRISTKSELVTSYHVTSQVIKELRQEVERLKSKMGQEREPRHGGNGGEVKQLREKIVETFKLQMELRRKLMEIDSNLLSLQIEAEKQHMIISNWEMRENRLYRSGGGDGSRARTQQSLRRKQTAESNSRSSDDVSTAAIETAWAELAEIEKETDRWHADRVQTEIELEECRTQGVALEDELPKRISSDDERELLALLCRVHELEADKLALQGDRIARIHELKRRDTALLRCERQRQLSDAIITRQRQIMEQDGHLKLPPDLNELYHMYQQEIYAATYSDLNKLPSISRDTSLFSRDSRLSSRDGSTSSSEYGLSPLPPLKEVSGSVDRLMGQVVPPPTRGGMGSVKFPKIGTSYSLPTKLPTSV